MNKLQLVSIEYNKCLLIRQFIAESMKILLSKGVKKLENIDLVKEYYYYSSMVNHVKLTGAVISNMQRSKENRISDYKKYKILLKEMKKQGINKFKVKLIRMKPDFTSVETELEAIDRIINSES